MKIPESLANHFLIAMPTLEDTFFSKSVIYLYEHSPKGAMGIVVNQSLQITLENLLQHLDIEVLDKDIADLPVLAGGPVGPEQGFVIHDRLDPNVDKDKVVAISASKDMLRDIGQGNGPENFIVALGYAGWEQGQLENEINRNDWLIAPIKPSVLFTTPLEQRWQKAAESIGVDINRLSGQIGHA